MARQKINIDPADVRISALKETPEFSVGDEVFTIVPKLILCPFCAGTGKLKRKAFVPTGWAQMIDVDVDCVCISGQFCGEMSVYRGRVIEVIHKMNSEGAIITRHNCDFDHKSGLNNDNQGAFLELYKSEKEAQKAADMVNQSGAVLKLVVE